MHSEILPTDRATDTALRETVVLSGKGGTGKTSVSASLAALAGDAVLADCDVDAANLHLLLGPEIQERHDFISGRQAVIRQQDCLACGACLAACRFDAVRMDGTGAGNALFHIDPAACEGCGVCIAACPVEAINFPERHCGEWMRSTTPFGPLIHARLTPGAENSGRLVSHVREKARQLARDRGARHILIDGPPGIGCPATAAITGADQVLLVTEPGVSAAHDLMRALELVRHFHLPAAVCINKWDINPDQTQRIEQACLEQDVPVLARLPYHPDFVQAQMDGRAVVEKNPDIARILLHVWQKLNGRN